MFRLFGLFVVGLVLASSISSAEASNMEELGGCGFFDESKSNLNWNIEKKFGPRYFKFYKGKSNFYYSVGTSDYSQSKATELEHKVNDAFNEWYFSDKNFRFEINKWSNAIQVQRIGKQNVGPFIGNTGGCGRLISKIKQSYSDSDFSPSAYLSGQSTEQIAKLACSKGQWANSLQRQNYVQEAKRRGLSCGVGESSTTQIASSDATNANTSSSFEIANLRDSQICNTAVIKTTTVPIKRYWNTGQRFHKFVEEAARRGLSCRVTEEANPHSHKFVKQVKVNNPEKPSTLPIEQLCAVSGLSSYYEKYTVEIKRRGLTCHKRASADDPIGHSQYDHQTTVEASQHSAKNKVKATTTKSNTETSAELEAERQKRIKLEQQLAALKAQQEQQQQTISNDTKLPTITIASASTTGAQGIIRGRVNDNTGIAELRVDGQKIAVDGNGNFSATTYVPEGGTSVNIEAIDLAGLSSTMSVRVDRAATQTASISFDRLNPLKRKAQSNKDAVALIIGIGTYENIIDAAYADKDALVFRDYATEKLGIPSNQIKTLINKEADIGEVLLGIRKWIRRSTKPDKTDVYVFYAGHGIATASGEAYILPYDGRPEVDLLDRTALLQKELFAEIDKANPRNVTIFLDACYTGKARTGEVLMADANYRPIAIRPIDDGMPDNFTLITASSGDEFSGPLEEAKHGLFSYFLMKGMEGDADSNQDKKITAGELHQFVKENVLRQSADKQTPELQGNADRVLVTFK